MAKKNVIIFFAVAFVLILIFFPAFSKYQKLLSERRQLEKKVTALEEDNKRLEEEKYKLQNDLEYVEKKAREKLGVVRKGEIPYKIKEEGKDGQ